MIRLIDLNIEDYRSITKTPLFVKFDNRTVLVGPNNCGKSNILRALQLFFNGKIDGENYSPDLDYPKNSNLSHLVQTKITVTVKYSSDEVNVIKAITDLEKQSKQKRLEENLLKLRLSYSKKGIESWQFIGKEGTRNIKKELIHKVRNMLRHSVRFKYIPVGRDSLESIQKEIGEELIGTIFSGWSGSFQTRRDINDAIFGLLSKLNPRLDLTANSLTKSMRDVFQEIKELKLQLPFSDLESMLPTLTPSVKDEYETSLKSKGAGIQTSSLLFFLKYLADNHPQRHNARITFLWAIEEPESFLHPAKQKGMANILELFSKEVQTIISTHCPHFVPRNSTASVHIVDKETSAPFSTKIVGHDYETARQSLGVTLLDSMYLYPINLVVEGPSDEIILRGALQKLKGSPGFDLDTTEVRFFPAGNATSACSLYETLLRFGDTNETSIRLIIDGDAAGKKALNGLIERLRNTAETRLRANNDYFQLTKDIEALTSKRIIEILEKKCPTQVDVTRDTAGNITCFIITELNKKKVADKIVELMTTDDLKGYLYLFKLINKSITKRS